MKNFINLLLIYSGVISLGIHVVTLVHNWYAKRLNYEIITFEDSVSAYPINKFDSSDSYDINFDIYFVFKNKSLTPMNIIYIEMIDITGVSHICPLDQKLIKMKWSDYISSSNKETYSYPLMTSEFPIHIPPKVAHQVCAWIILPKQIKIKKLLIHTDKKAINYPPLLVAFNNERETCVNQSERTS